jgi:hypothetical protein
MFEIFSENISNARNAITKKRYDLVTIQGNRILSDLAILRESLSQDDILLMALVGFISRRVGIDLQLLANFQKDSAKIRSVAIELLSTDILDTSDKGSLVLTFFNNYVRYLDHYAYEINSNDLSEYTREGKLNKPIFEWAIKELRRIDEELIIYGSPIKGISQELKRMSYVEKLSPISIIIQMLVESLEWYSDTVQYGISKIVRNFNSADQSPDIFKQSVYQTIQFLKSIIDLFKDSEFTSTTNLSESELKIRLAILPDILIVWRNLLNLFYNLQTLTIPRNSEKQEERNREGGTNES